MPTPDCALVKIDLSNAVLEEVLFDLCIEPRRLARKWAQRTNQTGQAKVSYIGQHLASVQTGVLGTGTAARGLDLFDGSEVKTCSRADQLGKCNESGCDGRIQPFEDLCPQCGSSDIKRMVDSHWIIAIRKREDLENLLARNRILLQLFDRERPTSPDIRFRVWEIWPREARHAHFVAFMTDYFEKNWSVKLERAAPANLHPLKYDFFLCNPILCLDAMLVNADPPGGNGDVEASVKISHRVLPTLDRATLDVEPMPAQLCKKAELEELVDGVPDILKACLLPGKRLDDLRLVRARGSSSKQDYLAVLGNLTEEARNHLKMRKKHIRNS